MILLYTFSVISAEAAYLAPTEKSQRTIFEVPKKTYDDVIVSDFPVFWRDEWLLNGQSVPFIGIELRSLAWFQGDYGIATAQPLLVIDTRRVELKGAWAGRRLDALFSSDDLDFIARGLKASDRQQQQQPQLKSVEWAIVIHTLSTDQKIIDEYYLWGPTEERIVAAARRPGSLCLDALLHDSAR